MFIESSWEHNRNSPYVIVYCHVLPCFTRYVSMFYYVFLMKPSVFSIYIYIYIYTVSYHIYIYIPFVISTRWFYWHPHLCSKFFLQGWSPEPLGRERGARVPSPLGPMVYPLVIKRGQLKLLTGWWFQTFVPNIWDVILPIDFHIFQDG